MIESDTRHYLIVFDTATGVMRESVRQFGPENVDEALSAYADAEARFAAEPSVHVVLIGSDSLESVKQTHSTFFRSTTDELGAAIR